LTDKSLPDRPILVGISSCLLGQEVRHDGGHKRHAWINQTLGRFLEFRPVCPEVGIGLGVPRPTIQLSGNVGKPRVIGTRDPEFDVTDALAEYGRRKAGEMQGISGYIFKNRSPSCGVWRVNVWQGEGLPPRKEGRGAYAAAFMAWQPLLPVEEEGRLGDAVLRESFIERVFAYRRWQELVAGGLSPATLVKFHETHKLCLMSHNPQRLRKLGKLVAVSGSEELEQLADNYVRGFMETLSIPASRKSNTNVLQHLMGYLKKQLDSEDKAELLEIIEAYRTEQLPLIVPITLLNHHFRRYPHPYVADQVYLHPHPRELMLRNTI
jgi:uncharacterized protein YbgA (DUF1722 family)/uncharacterized protein YbbK (DUF523 family)